MKFTGLLDMINGGGAGASGTQFKGAPISGLLNALGVKPHGYRDRMEGMENTRPQMRPEMGGSQPSRPAPEPMQSGPMARPNNGPRILPMISGPQNGRPNNAPEQPMQYGGRGQTGMPVPPGVDVTDDEIMRVLAFLRSTQQSPF